jgi:hypothetical protein
MVLSNTLELLRAKEHANEKLLAKVLSTKRHYHHSNLAILRGAEAYYLPAVNKKARIKWGSIFIRQIFHFFKMSDDKTYPHVAVYLVTLADRALVELSPNLGDRLGQAAAV